MTRLYLRMSSGGGVKRRSRAFAWLRTLDRGFSLGVVTHDVTKEGVAPRVYHVQ